jgi:hypothetical protein
MNKKTEVWQGTLAFMVLRTFETSEALHGYGITRRIEQTIEIMARLLAPAGRRSLSRS